MEFREVKRMEKEANEVKVKLLGMDEAIEKVERYFEILKEAKTLANELASMEFDIVFNEDKKMEI